MLSRFGLIRMLLGPSNISLCTFPFLFYPQHATAPSDVLFPGNRLSLLPLLLQSQLSLPALWPLLLLGFTVGAVSFPSPVEVPALPRSQMWKSSDVTLARTHFDTSRWLEMVGGQPSEKKKRNIPRRKGMNTERASDLQAVNAGAIKLINQYIIVYLPRSVLC